MKYWRAWHKWLGLVIGIQVLLWISGGVVMSAIPLDIVRGEHVLKPLPDLQLPPLANSVQVDVSQYVSVTWHHYHNRVVLKARAFSGSVELIDPVTGGTLAPLSDREAAEVARSRYLGEAAVADVELLKAIPAEARHLSGPFYRVVFDDWSHTRFYIDALSAEVRSVRSDIWQFYDFFWMLHIMDYDTRKDFNHPLLIVAALIALVFTACGLVLIYFAVLRPKIRKLLYHLGPGHKSA